MELTNVVIELVINLPSLSSVSVKVGVVVVCKPTGIMGDGVDVLERVCVIRMGGNEALGSIGGCASDEVCEVYVDPVDKDGRGGGTGS